MKRIAFALLCLLGVSCNTAAVKRSYMSLDQDGNRKRTTFFTDTEQIYCIGELAVGRKDLSITASLRSVALARPSTGMYFPLASTLAVEDVTTGSTGSDVLVSFELLKTNAAAPWAAGDFVCDLALDGELEASVPFEIRYPDCPVAPPRSGDACAGFFLPESSCIGAHSDERCECTNAGVWQCR